LADASHRVDDVELAVAAADVSRGQKGHNLRCGPAFGEKTEAVDAVEWIEPGLS
jgi:hypothetical protein